MDQTTTQKMYTVFRFVRLSVKLTPSILVLVLGLVAPRVVSAGTTTLTVYNTGSCQYQVNNSIGKTSGAFQGNGFFNVNGGSVSNTSLAYDETFWGWRIDMSPLIYLPASGFGYNPVVIIDAHTNTSGNCVAFSVSLPDRALLDNRGGSGSDDSNPCGMPVWAVSQPFISLGLNDEPLGYQPALGARVSFSLSYKQRGDANIVPNFFGVGPRWYSPWLSYVIQDPATVADLPVATNMIAVLPHGQRATFINSNNADSNIRITGDATNGFTLNYPNGAKDVYGFVVTNKSHQFVQAFLSEKWTEVGQKMTFEYVPYVAVPANSYPVIRLARVIDGDGRTNTISYVSTNAYSTNLISQVTDPFGRSTYLAYDSQGNLTNITDTAGLSSSCGYDFQGWITNLTTPYGTTSFSIADELSTNTPPNGRGRSILVTLPNSSHELFLYTNSAAGVPSSYGSAEIPSVTPYSQTFDTNDLSLRTSFHWGPKQYSNLSTTNMAAFTANDFRLAHMSHWLKATDTNVGPVISFEREASPDGGGTIEGQKTWYDYAGKTNSQYEGTQSMPLCIAQVLPDGTTNFVRTVRNIFGAVTTNVSTYSIGSGVGLRTNVFRYSTNNIDLIAATNALGIRTITNTYNSFHEILSSMNASNELTAFTYDASNRLTSITRPSGLVTTNTYGADKYLATSIEKGFATNSYTYSNALLYAHTDARGLRITNTWDNLNRLTSVTFPDGTYISNRYTFLDLTATKDRLDHWSYFGYDQLRHNTNVVDRLGNTNVFTYCPCGALESVQDALGSVTQYYYDNQMRVTGVVYPDNYSVTNFYNLIGQLTNTVDSFGASVTNIFNNQGLLIGVSNAFGQVQATTYDILDRTTNTTDANGVSVSTTYDNLNRVLSRTYPDTGVEKWGYTQKARDATSYTNQVTNAVTYGYDPMDRLTNQINVGIRTNKFFYNGAGDLTNLVDGNLKSTKWGYDIFGRNTNKVDATNGTVFTFKYDAENRMTNRTSAGKGTTIYSYDNEGNILTVAYPSSPSITFSYDALHRMTNMTDAVGTSKFNYTTAGQLQAEDGPWSSDTLSYSYDNRLRSGFTLQQPMGAALSQSYGYDASRRLINIISTAGTFTYSYDPIRKLQVQKLTLPNFAFITNNYDSVSRLTDTWLKNSSDTILNYHGYLVNRANQRTRQTRFNNDYVDYTYDAAGQLKTASAKESGGSPLRYNEQLGYKYDPAGNLQYRTNNTLIQNFVVNSLNEISNVTSSGKFTVDGTTTSAASTVTVNGTNAQLYSDATFAATNMPLVSSYTAIAHDTLGRADTNTVTLNLSTNVSFRYDADGNLTNDGLRSFQYDDENQLISIWASNAWKSDFAYDGLRRKRVETNYVWNTTSSIWVKSSERRFVYDGNLVVEERDANNRSQVYYTRGRDLSGTLAGAGGIDGLLSRTPTTDYVISSSAAHAFYFTDGNGNVTMLTGTNQSVVAKYVYDSFGNTVARSGPLADINLYRFSSKELHLNSGLIYFGRRFYDPNLQRWINCDPSGQAYSLNLFAFVSNQPTDNVDPLGDKENNTVSTISYTPPFNVLPFILPASNSRLDLNSQPSPPPIAASTGILSAPPEKNISAESLGATFYPQFGDSPMAARMAMRNAEDVLMGVSTGIMGEWIAWLRRAQCFKATTGTRTMRNVVYFNGMEVRAVRDLSHLDQQTLEAMQQYGFSGTTESGDTIILHHLEQDPAGPVVEMPSEFHSIGNEVQHPFGNIQGAGLSDAQRGAFNNWRAEYWKWRATQALNTRRVLGP